MHWLHCDVPIPLLRGATSRRSRTGTRTSSQRIRASRTSSGGPSAVFLGAVWARGDRVVRKRDRSGFQPDGCEIEPRATEARAQQMPDIWLDKTENNQSRPLLR